MEKIYVCYTHMKGYEIRFSFLPDKDAYDLVQESANTFGYHVSELHQDSTRESDPVIDVLAITEGRLSMEEAVGISQDAINWLFDNGHMTLPPEAFK